MYIHSLDCDWMAHAFLRNQFMLRKEADLQRILASGATSVYIDTLKGLDLGNAPAAWNLDPNRFLTMEV